MASGTKDLLSKMEQLAKCPICIDRVRDPRTLPCQHTFCIICLQNFIGNVRIFACPSCRQETKVPCGGVECFPKPLHLANILDILEESQPKHATDKCSKPSELCQEHDKPVSAFCQNCSLMVCTQCLENTHINHASTGLEYEATRQQYILEELRSKMVDHLEKLQSEELEADTALRNAEEKKADAISCLSINVQKLIRIIQDHEKVIEEDIAMAAGEAFDQFRSTKDNLASKRAQLVSCIRQISDCLDGGSSTEIIRISVDQATTFKHTICQKNINIPEFVLDISFPGYESFSKSNCIATVTHELGNLVVCGVDQRENLRVCEVGRFKVIGEAAGICHTPNGDLVVCQRFDNAVLVYSSEGVYKFNLRTKHSTKAWAPLCHSNKIYISDFHDGSVLVYNLEGKLQECFHAGFVGAGGLGIEDEIMYVTSEYEHKVLRVDLSTKGVSTLLSLINGSTYLTQPLFMSVAGGDIALSCEGSGRVLVYDVHGNHKYSCPNFSWKERTINHPRGVLLDTTTGLLYIADKTMDRIHIASSKDGKLLETIHLSCYGLECPCGLATGKAMHFTVACRDTRTKANMIVVFMLEMGHR